MPGGGEIIVILVLVLLLFGPDKLPDLARQLGRGVRELNRMKSNLTDQFNLMDDEAPHRANATSSTRNAALPEAEETEESHGWESYAARRTETGQFGSDSARDRDLARDDDMTRGSDSVRDEDDIAEDAAFSTSASARDDASDWRNCAEEPPMKTENAFTSTTLNDDFSASPRAIPRAAAPNKMRDDDAI